MRFRLTVRRVTALLVLLCALLLTVPQVAFAEGTQGEAAPRAASTYATSVVHYGPSFGYTVIGCVEDGTHLTVLEDRGDFLKIDCYDMVGYIAKTQVRQENNGEYYVNCKEGSQETSLMSGFTTQEVLELRSTLCTNAKQYIGVPYVSGGTSPWGFDCCGYTQFLYKQIGINLERNQNNQLRDGVIVAKEDMQPGDLVFFENTYGYGVVASHVGMYIGNGKMIHAANGGIEIQALDDAYYTKHYLCARRVILSNLTENMVQTPLGLGQNFNSAYWRDGSQN